LRQQIDLEHNNEVLMHMREELNTTLENLEKQVEDRTNDLKTSNKRLLQEIEEHKHTNMSLKNTKEQFYQAQKMESLGTLVGGISHDFNNMLSGINANLFLIQRQTKDLPKVQLKLDDIEKLVFHAADMIKQLLTFARKDKVEMKNFDMSPFLAEAIKLAEVPLPPRMRLQQDLCSKPLPMQGNATQLQQVMMNLVNNARDALSGHHKPIIHIHLALLQDALEQRNHHPNLQGEWIYLSVRDNGSGIAKDKLEHIFEPFFSTKKEGEGTGLGLAMCYGAIQSHGGVIEVDSEVEVGTSFHIYLPLGEATAAPANTGSVGSSLSGHGEKILLVDDDDSLRDAHSDVLESLGYAVIEACNGLEAIKLYAEQGEAIDLVIMDIMMPEMGGMKAAQHILIMNPDVNIFFATGYDKDSSTERFDSRELTQLDAIKRLSKPFTIEVLSKMIRAELAGKV
ncbi:MAG: ATP-binding protein, partial [Ghiorsea sp.]